MINIDKIKEVRKILEDELSMNMKTYKDNDINRLQYNQLCILVGNIANFISFLENPNKYIKNLKRK